MDREIFLSRLEALRGYLDKVRSFRQVGREEFVRQAVVHDLAERYLHLMMECVIDLGNHYLADRDLGIAETNREVFELLAKAGEIPPDLAAALRQWAGFRNVLVHEYLRIDHGIAWQAVQNDLVAIDRLFQWATGKLQDESAE